ncbi:MAG: hypothetical protein AB7E55_31945 [Pigmentiphaga sp.]
MSHAQEQPPAIRVRRTAATQPRPIPQTPARPTQASAHSHPGNTQLGNPLLVVAGIILAVFGAVAMVDGLLMVVDSVANLLAATKESNHALAKIGLAAARSTLSTSEIVFLLGSITVGVGGLLVASGKR